MLAAAMRHSAAFTRMPHGARTVRRTRLSKPAMSTPMMPRPEDRNQRPSEPPPAAPPYRSEGFFEDLPSPLPLRV